MDKEDVVADLQSTKEMSSDQSDWGGTGDPVVRSQENSPPGGSHLGLCI